MELIIKIDGRNMKGKALLKYLKSLAEADNFIVIKEKKAELEDDIKQAFKEVKQHKTGKKNLKTAKQLLDEL